MTSAYGAYHSRPPFGRRAIVHPAFAQQPQAMSAPATALSAAADFSIGHVLRRALGVLGPNAITFIALIALAAVPERALYHFSGLDGKLLETASKLVLMLAGQLLQLAVMRLALDALGGKPASFGACVGQAFLSFFPVLGLSLLAAVPLALALVALVVPGLMLGLAWAVIIPVRIAEGTPIMACFKRSAELTRGHRWKIIAVFLVMGFVLGPLLLVLQLLWGIPLAAHTAFFTQNWLARLLFQATMGLMLAATYAELRADETVNRTAFD